MSGTGSRVITCSRPGQTSKLLVSLPRRRKRSDSPGKKSSQRPREEPTTQKPRPPIFGRLGGYRIPKISSQRTAASLEDVTTQSADTGPPPPTEREGLAVAALELTSNREPRARTHTTSTQTDGQQKKPEERPPRRYYTTTGPSLLVVENGAQTARERHDALKSYSEEVYATHPTEERDRKAHRRAEPAKRPTHRNKHYHSREGAASRHF